MSDSALPVDVLLAQGCCCGSGCENCPYNPTHQAGSMDINQDWINYAHTHPGITRDAYEKAKTAPAV